MRFDILSLFPGYFKGPFDESIVKRAWERGLIEINLVDIRDFACDKYRRVDDRPYGGGPGMVLMPAPVEAAIEAVRGKGTRVIYLSPQGAVLNALRCRGFATCEHIVLLCGHYEGVDQRVLETMVDEEISIGDYVLTSGCPAAAVFVDAVARFIPGVVGKESSVSNDSFEKGLLDCPHYTRPEEYKGRRVPEVLLSGDHGRIDKWRRTMARRKTEVARPDLIKIN